MSPTEQKKQLKMILGALDRFPQIVATQAKKYKARQKFLKETFGDAVKQILRHDRKSRVTKQ